MADFHGKALDKLQAGDWEGAHDLVQDFGDELSCLIHGYLHRIEGDISNARYWYTRAGHTLPTNSLEDEFVRLCNLIK